MKQSQQPLPFPIKGLVTNIALNDQPPQTTPTGVNVRGYEPLTGRDRGGQREGLSKYNTNAISGTNPIQCITHCVFAGAGVAQMSPRIIRPIAISQGNLKRFTSGAGVPTTPTNGAGAFSATATLIFADQLFNQVLFADGVTQIKLYDAPTDAVSSLTPSVGSLPVDSGGNPARLVVVWRQRLVLSGLPLDPRNWFMSASGDATNWNYAPSPSVETQAVAGNNTTAGESPDVINCMIPYNDEVLLLGGDHSIWQITGDPMAGGRIDPVTDAVGMAWGQPWCRDGTGQVYFVSNRGSIYKIVPGAIPERISDPISELLLTTNVSTKACRMAWDERQQGFHVWLTTFASASADTHYYYDTRNQAWWQDTYGNNNLNPYSVHTLDGDAPGDRAILVGSFDGFIRKVDQSALDDDGTGISSSVLLGPLKDRQGSGTYLSDLDCSLDAASGTVSWGVLLGNNPQNAFNATAAQTGTFSAGRNRSVPLNRFGHAFYVKLSSSAAAQSWQLELIRATVRAPEGDLPRKVFVS